MHCNDTAHNQTQSIRASALAQLSDSGPERVVGVSGSQSLTMIVRQNQAIFGPTLTPPRDSRSLSEALLRGVVPTFSGLIQVGSTSQRERWKNGQDRRVRRRQGKGKEEKKTNKYSNFTTIRHT